MFLINEGSNRECCHGNKIFDTLLVLIFASTNFRGDRIDQVSRVLIFADLPNQDISRVLIFADCRRKFPFFTFPKPEKI